MLHWNTILVQKQQNKNVETATAPFRRFCSVIVSLSVVFTRSGFPCSSAVSTFGVRAVAESAHKDRQLSGYRHQRFQERVQPRRLIHLKLRSSDKLWYCEEPIVFAFIRRWSTVLESRVLVISTALPFLSALLGPLHHKQSRGWPLSRLPAAELFRSQSWPLLRVPPCSPAASPSTCSSSTPAGPVPSVGRPPTTRTTTSTAPLLTRCVNWTRAQWGDKI